MRNIIIDGDDISGYGVNVAAQVEKECEPGEVYLSEDAYRQFAAIVRREKSLDRIKLIWNRAFGACVQAYGEP